ncbi:MAG: lysostaphin resistance A-like protein [Candidatus Binatia bacterium]
MNRRRWEAGKELGVLFGLWNLTVWGAWSWTGASIWAAAGLTAFVAALCRFVSAHRSELKSAGLRFDNFGRSLVISAVPVGVLLLISFIAAPTVTSETQPMSANRAIQTLASGVAQQAFFLGYLFQRWTVLMGNPLAAVCANALSFSFVHLPNLSLVVVTALSGLFFGLLFLRAPNVFAIGVAHGVLSLLGGPLLQSSGLLETKRIGPAELAPLAQVIAAEWSPGDRIGLGPHAVAAALLGRGFETSVEPIGSAGANEAFNRDRLAAFLKSNGRVFCVLTERDFRSYIDSEVGRKLLVLGERFIVRRKFTFDRDLGREFFLGNGDLPVLGALRERVLLVSNRPREG